MIKGISLTDIFIDCNNPDKLLEFYYNLTGWEKVIKYDSQALKTKEGLTVFFKECDVPYVPPVWTEKIGEQQKQMHLDFAVDNLQEAVDEALKMGAGLAEEQYGGDHWVTLLDPEGHPFCFGVDE